MRPPYSEYAAPPIYVYPVPPKRGIRFSRTELFQLGVAVLALSAAFTVAILTPIYGGISNLALFPNALEGIGFFFLAALVSVGSGVGLHEIMHKVTAQRYGHWAEFRYSLRGLAMAFVFAFLGVIFGAPGATYISGAITPDQNGKISAAGPVTNIVLGLAFFGLEVLVFPIASTVAGFLGILLEYAASVNLILAGFNMIPILPLDGAKVWYWSKAAWIGILALVVAILGFGSYRGYLFL
jgi:Zn-dependent protease